MNAPDAETLIHRIYREFHGVVLGEGISLIEAEYADGGKIAPATLREQEEAEDWTKIINDRLCEFISTFSFTDHLGFRFYIAPYMVWTLRNFETSSAIIADFTIYAIDPTKYQFQKNPFDEVFTLPQMECMREFLLFAVDHPDSLDSRVATINLKALEKYCSR